jgi:5-methylthioadenosine/S-adenosylhomocysteine deaminase
MVQVHAADWVVPVVAPPLRDGAVAVDDAGAIVEVAPREAVLGRHPGAELVEHGAAAILPGFVNAHTHLEYAVYGGFGDAMPFAPWLADHIRRKRALDEDAVLASATLGAEASLRTGVTCVADCAFAGATVEALRATGLRGTVYLEAFGAKGADPAAVAQRTARP